MPKANGITRQEILNSIKCHGTMTAEELSRELNISQVAVRQHLASLESENLITISVERRRLGRPSHRYLLTEGGDETFPRSYDKLTHAILDELRAWQGDDAVEQLIARRRERMYSLFQARLKERPLQAQVYELARILDENGFMAEACEEEEGKFRLVKRNCAICAVARHYPTLCCHGEEPLLTNLLGEVEVTLTRSIVDGDHLCEFSIRARD